MHTKNPLKRKGIILAGGSGTRLHPLTTVISKQLLPVYDKPLVYYPLTTLMLAGIQDILLITTPHDIKLFQALLGDGSQWGIRISYAQQPSPDGLAQAMIIGEKFLDGHPSVLILGDNMYYGHELGKVLQRVSDNSQGATIFATHVKDPHRYGIVEINGNGAIVSVEEKPQFPKSNYAITGLYFYDENAPKLARSLKPSPRGELEITDLNRLYLTQGLLNVELLGRGYTWMDAGTHESLMQASQFVEIVESRQDLKIACPEEIAYNLGWISQSSLEKAATVLAKSSYGEYLARLVKEEKQKEVAA